MINTVRRVSHLVALFVLALAGVATAANYPLELTNIRAEMDPKHRIARAYPGLEYNVRAAVIGGAYPYTFRLENAPAGMAVNERTGEIRWVNPAADASPTLHVRDSDGSTVSATWTIRVTTDGFRFIDALNGKNAEGNGCSANCGAGTHDSPWRSTSDMYHHAQGGEVVYFRSGTYVVTDLPRSGVGSGWDRVEFAERTRPVIWLAEPGHAPVLDFAYKPDVEVGPLIRFTGPNVYVDGFETINSHIIAFQTVSGPMTGPTFRRMRMHAHGPALEGANAAFIMTTTDSRPTQGMVIQDCEFWDVQTSVTIKIYAQNKLLIEDTVHHQTGTAIELKDDIRQFTVRSNTFYDIKDIAIGGNMHEGTTHGEILYNHARAGIALDLNQDGMAGPIHVYRNTLIGRIRVRNTDSTDGPFYLSDNVIVSGDRGNDGRVYFDNVTAPDRVVLSDNLVGGPRDKLVDEKGELTDKFSQHRGTRGHKH